MPVDVAVGAVVWRTVLDGGVGGTGMFINPPPRRQKIFFRQFEPVGASLSSSTVSSRDVSWGELDGSIFCLPDFRVGV